MAVGDRIGIADKTTLDQVKTNTDNILGNFPINGGTDFANLQTNLKLSIGTQQSTLVVDVTGKGILHSLVNTTGATVSLTIQIDNGSIYTLGMTSPSSLQLLCGFKSGLKIYANTSDLGVIYSLI